MRLFTGLHAALFVCFNLLVTSSAVAQTAGGIAGAGHFQEQFGRRPDPLCPSGVCGYRPASNSVFTDQLARDCASPQYNCRTVVIEPARR